VAGSGPRRNVKHHRTALFALFTALDGKDAPNPLRDVKPLRTDDPEPRAIPYAIIDAILDAMPNCGRADRGKKRGEDSKTKARLKVMWVCRRRRFDGCGQ
jgi:hypothetical protein